MKLKKTREEQAAEALRASIQQAAQGKSQTELARLLGITPQYVCDMMGGRRKWGAQRLDLLASELGFPDVLLWHRLGATADGWRVEK